MDATKISVRLRGAKMSRVSTSYNHVWVITCVGSLHCLFQEGRHCIINGVERVWPVQSDVGDLALHFIEHWWRVVAIECWGLFCHGLYRVCMVLWFCLRSRTKKGTKHFYLLFSLLIKQNKCIFIKLLNLTKINNLFFYKQIESC